MSFIFGGNAGISYAELQQRRKALNARKGRFSAPKNAGEGLTASGIALANRIEGNRLNKAEAAGRKSFNSAFGGNGDVNSHDPAAANTSSPSGYNPSGSTAVESKPTGLSGDRQTPVDALLPATIEESQRTGVDPHLIRLMSNPYASPGQKALIQLMVQQQLKANAPVDPLKQLQLEKAQIELERLRNPQADPMKELQLQKMQLELQRMQNPERSIVEGADGFKYYQDTGERVLPNIQSQDERVKGINVGENLVNPVTGEVIYQSGPSGPDFEIEQKLRKEFESREGVGTFRKIRDAWGRVQASGDTPAGDVALIFNYMKMLDPGSVVREGEFATAQNSAGIPERARALYNQTLTGQRLTRELRKDFIGQAKQLFDIQAQTYNTVAGQYRGLAEQYGLEPGRIAALYEMAEAGDPRAQQAVQQMEQNTSSGANADLPAPPEGIDPAAWPDIWKHLIPEERKHFQ